MICTILSFSCRGGCVSREPTLMRPARPPLQLFTSTSPFARGMGIVRNRNCPACKNLRKSEANPVDARQFPEIAFAANHFRKGALRPFPAGGLIDALATAHRPAKSRDRPRARTGKARLPRFQQYAIRR